MSSPFEKKVLENLRLFGSERFGSMQKLAEAMGVRPQNLNAYLKGERKLGPKYIARLKEIGFKIDNTDNTNCVIEDEKPLNIDIAGAIELSNTPASRLAQLVGVSPATFTAWQNGTATPTVEELSRLFNQVVALALSSRHATTTQATAEPESPRSATA
jgi:transcriptional regulator with XRE-family HTH domain